MNNLLKKRPTCVSFFSGVGGLDLGLHQSGFQIKCFNDIDENCNNSLRLNWPKTPILEKSIHDITGKELYDVTGLKKGDVDLISGGPPCQPYSKSGFWLKYKWDENKENNNKKYVGTIDDRSFLISDYIRLIIEIKPRAILFENVQGLSYKTSKHVLTYIEQSLNRAGYGVEYEIINTANYGVPQIRKRLILVGLQDGGHFEFPEFTHYKSNEEKGRPIVTAGESIGDLDDGKVADAEKVKGKWGHLLKEIPPGNNYLYYTKKRGHPNPIFKWRSKYWNFLLKLSPGLPSWTIQASPGPNVGPFHWQNRRLRIPEVMRLQSFPDDYKIYGVRNQQWKQLGDAVPPLLSKKIGEALLDYL